jgi:hypothetical protein
VSHSLEFESVLWPKLTWGQNKDNNYQYTPQNLLGNDDGLLANGSNKGTPNGVQVGAKEVEG